MSLLAEQRAFRAAIVADDDGPAPPTTGMAIYRNAYRGRLMTALEVSFERTRRWVGQDSFSQAASHYILTHPPQSWTIDLYGADFPACLAALFREDAEVPELAWLEWQMQQAFAAPDRPELDVAALAARGLTAEDWGALRFGMAAGFATRRVSTNCAALWNALDPARDAGSAPDLLDGEHLLIVWRKAMQPHFRLLDPSEALVIERIAAGQTLTEAAHPPPHADPEHFATQLGGWLAAWLGEGLFATAY